MRNPTHAVRNIHRNARYPDRVYAHLVDLSTGEIVVSATIEYILDAVKERGYVTAEVKPEKENK